MYNDYFRNYGSQPTYKNGYDEYLDYENDFYSMDNDYNRFATRPVSATPYNYDNRTYMDVSNMYPDIYKQISPIIDRKLNSCNFRSIDNSMLEKLTFAIYDEVIKTDIGKKLNTTNNNQNTSNSGFSQSYNKKITNQGMTKYSSTSNANYPSSASSKKSNKDNVQETSVQPSRNNCLLCDLIKIMILNNLVGNQKTPKPEPRMPFQSTHRAMIPEISPDRLQYQGQDTLGQGNYQYLTNNMPRQGRDQYLGNNILSQRRSGTGQSYFDVPYPEDFNYQ